MKVGSSLNIGAEMAFGENSEVRIVQRWAAKSVHGKTGNTVIKTPSYAVLDFLVLDKQGVPCAWLEIKRRRTALAKYGDAICAWKKHLFARKLAEDWMLPVLLVTEYGCGSLVEVDLTTEPAAKREIQRRDRPESKPVPHALYSLDQLTILERETN